jgi:DNA-binding IclR family transcriptional regulator
VKRVAREIVRLNRIRLETDLSYQELADEIGVPLKTLHRLLTDDVQQRCFDRTHYRITEFLKKFDAHERRMKLRRAALRQHARPQPPPTSEVQS